MQIGILGINHKSADLTLREKFAKACARLFGTECSLYALFSWVLLSTCNRTEIYFQSEDPTDTHTYILNALRNEIREEFEHRIYTYFGSDCFFHLARVTAGVDSALIGESEIQGQVKRAYEDADRLSPELHFLFQKALKIGKDIRSNAQFMQNALSIEEAVLNAIAEHLPALTQPKILLVGLSEINYKILLRLRQQGIGTITLCNRSDQKAEWVAAQKEVFPFSRGINSTIGPVLMEPSLPPNPPIYSLSPHTLKMTIPK